MTERKKVIDTSEDRKSQKVFDAPDRQDRLPAERRALFDF